MTTEYEPHIYVYHCPAGNGKKFSTSPKDVAIIHQICANTLYPRMSFSAADPSHLAMAAPYAPWLVHPSHNPHGPQRCLPLALSATPSTALCPKPTVRLFLTATVVLEGAPAEGMAGLLNVSQGLKGERKPLGECEAGQSGCNT